MQFHAWASKMLMLSVLFMKLAVNDAEVEDEKVKGFFFVIIF